MLDLYCERITAELWAEPINAVSNIAFLVAVVAVLPQVKKQWPGLAFGNRLALITLILLVLATCIGSSAFHILASKASLLADVIPIVLFQMVFLAAHGRVLLGWSYIRLGLLLGLFIGVSVLLSNLPLPLNGSQSYLAPLLFLSGLAWLHAKKLTSAPNTLWLAVGCFMVSLTFRTADNALCEALPMGTHFLWHLCNGVVLYLCMHAYLVAASSGPVTSLKAKARVG